MSVNYFKNFCPMVHAHSYVCVSWESLCVDESADVLKYCGICGVMGRTWELHHNSNHAHVSCDNLFKSLQNDQIWRNNTQQRHNKKPERCLQYIKYIVHYSGVNVSIYTQYCVRVPIANLHIKEIIIIWHFNVTVFSVIWDSKSEESMMYSLWCDVISSCFINWHSTVASDKYSSRVYDPKDEKWYLRWWI